MKEKKKSLSNISNRARRVWVTVLVAFLVLLLGAAAFAAYKWMSSGTYKKNTMFNPVPTLELSMAPDAVPPPTAAPTPTPEPGTDPSWVSYNGAHYKPKENVISVLFFGIDTDERELHTEFTVNSYQADTIMLGVIDTDTRKLRILNIPRDVITPVKVLDMFFNYSRTEDAQLCLQHAYGDGGEMSAQLMTEAVSTLLDGVPVYQYVSMDLSGIEVATDAVGGVELTLLEDFTAENGHMRKGRTMTLNGKQARIYCQRRTLSSFDNTLNASRMQRQVQFCKAFLAAVKAKVKENPTFVVSLYEKMGDSILTNMSMDELLYLANLGLELNGIDESLFEKLAVVDTSTEDVTDVRPDQDAIRAQLIDLFYEPVD